MNIRISGSTLSLAALLVIAGCGSATSQDRSPCFEKADCADDCENIANSEVDATLESFICKPDLCSCGISTEGACFAIGGVVGRVEVGCPASEERVSEQVDAAISYAESNGEQ